MKAYNVIKPSNGEPVFAFERHNPNRDLFIPRGSHAWILEAESEEDAVKQIEAYMKTPNYPSKSAHVVSVSDWHVLKREFVEE